MLIERRSRLTPWVIGVAALVLASGSAYAGQSLAKNSVASRQVKNGSLTGKDVKDGSLTGKDLKDGSVAAQDVKDGSLRAADLAPGTVPEVHSFIGTVPGNGVPVQVLEIPGFSRFDVSCSGSVHDLTVRFGPAPPVPPGTPRQQHGISASDVIDTDPAGAITITGTAGGAGFANTGGSPPASGVAVVGDYWGRSADRLAHGTFSLAFPSSGGCLTRLQVTVQRLTTPVPVPRAAGTARGGSGASCEATGTAVYCLEP